MCLSPWLYTYLPGSRYRHQGRIRARGQVKAYPIEFSNFLLARTDKIIKGKGEGEPAELSTIGP